MIELVGLSDSTGSGNNSYITTYSGLRIRPDNTVGCVFASAGTSHLISSALSNSAFLDSEYGTTTTYTCWGGYIAESKKITKYDYSLYGYVPYVSLSESPDKFIGIVCSLKKQDYPEDGCDGDYYYKLVTTNEDIPVVNLLPKLLPLLTPDAAYQDNGKITGFYVTYPGSTISLIFEDYDSSYMTTLGYSIGANILIYYNSNYFKLSVTDIYDVSSGAIITGDATFFDNYVIGAKDGSQTYIDADGALYYLIV